MIIRSILFCFLLINLTNGLRWISSGFVPATTGKADTLILLKLTSDPPRIDVSIGEEVIVVKDLQSYAHSITIYCFVGGYSKISELSYRFCKNLDCTVAINEKEGQKSMTAYNLEITVEAKFQDKKGMRVEFKFPALKPGEEPKDVSGNYYCEARDVQQTFMIRSNNIQLRDVRYWEQNLVQNPGNDQTPTTITIFRNNTPVSLPCLAGGLTLNSNRPKWAEQQFVSPVLWSMCPVMNDYENLAASNKMTFAHCKTYTVTKMDGIQLAFALEPKGLSSFPSWNAYVNWTGALTIFSMQTSTEPIFTYAFMCYYKKGTGAVPINTYFVERDGDGIKKGIVVNQTQVKYMRPLLAISPLVQNVNIFARSLPSANYNIDPLPVVSIFALYQSSSDSKFQWTFNGIQLNSGELISINAYRVNFVSTIDSRWAGTYRLIVMDGTDRLEFTINVAVLGPPTLADPACVPWVRHVWEHDSTELRCTYKDRPEKEKVGINSELIPFNQPLAQSQVTLSKSFAYLSELNFTLSLNKTSIEMSTVTYKVFNLRKTTGQIKYQDHSFMFSVENDYGLSVKSTSIYVVPRLAPLIQVAPETKNCTAACSSAVGHSFQCRIDVAPYEHKELVVDHYWTISSHRLEQKSDLNNKFAFYFDVNPDTKDLYMRPIVSNDTDRDKFVKSALIDNFIICHLDLRSAGSGFFYNSVQDLSLGNRLKAKITLDYQPLNTAYIYWIVAVILALLIIIIMIVLLTRYCMRNKGETYKLDKIEREHGYDPEKEVQEEMFKPYEREEHDPDALSASTGDRKLSITGHSVGSADDGELDNYDLDPSNFNEDGSIIGKYGANPRNRAAMT